MTLREWGRNAVSAIRDDGVREGSRQAIRELYTGMFRTVGRHWNYGRRVYDEEWDLLIVLDACRADLLAEVTDEYAFLTRESAYSCASASGEWHRKNFGQRYATEKAGTALVSANPYTDMHIDRSEFAVVEEVWRDAFDESLGTIPADRVVDRTIAAGREHDPDRLIAHFMQPHYPFVPDTDADTGGGIALGYDHTPWNTVWDDLREGTVDRDSVWSGYTANLRYVLDHVGTLLDNVDAERVLITADHGNLLGEWGLYAHPQYVPIPALKRVPWVYTTATDEETHEPAVDDERATTDSGDDRNVSVEDQLEALGYK